MSNQNNAHGQQESGYEIKERRRSPRVKREVTVQFRIKELPMEARTGSFHIPVDISRTNNLSGKGICFSAGSFIPVHAILDIKLQLPIQRETVHLEGRVVSCEEVKKNYVYGVRVEFINIDAECHKVLSQFVEIFLNPGKK